MESTSTSTPDIPESEVAGISVADAAVRQSRKKPEFNVTILRLEQEVIRKDERILVLEQKCDILYKIKYLNPMSRSSSY